MAGMGTSNSSLTLSSGLGIGGGSFAGPGGASSYISAYTAPLLSGIDSMYAGQTKRVNDTFDRNAGTLTGNLYSRGLGTSSLIDSANLGNEDQRQQALLDLSGQESQARSQAFQAGAGLGLQNYGIDQNTAEQDASRNLQASEFQQNYGLQEQQLAAQNRSIGLSRSTAMRTIGPQSGGQYLSAGSVGFGGAYPGSFQFT